MLSQFCYLHNIPHPVFRVRPLVQGISHRAQWRHYLSVFIIIYNIIFTRLSSSGSRGPYSCKLITL
jgi:hypothetical protein